MAEITLITGGTRSGKSRLAQTVAGTRKGKKIFVATACAFDEEMKDRIQRHREERGERFITIEEPYDPGIAIKNLSEVPSVIIIDCLTVWMGNMLHVFDNKQVEIDEKVKNLFSVLDFPPCDLVIVTNETGMGIVPDNTLARKFRDFAGEINRMVSGKADNVYLCVCGIPITVKGKRL
jgi:adenosylcobinamide kinase/adenosylcobinamide-phosphate guanylyltransferase